MTEKQELCIGQPDGAQYGRKNKKINNCTSSRKNSKKNNNQAVRPLKRKRTLHQSNQPKSASGQKAKTIMLAARRNQNKTKINLCSTAKHHKQPK